MVWGALIGGGLGLLGSLFGSKKSKDEKRYQQAMASLADYQRQRGQRLDAQAMPLLGRSQSFYDALLRGDQDTLMQYYGPSIRQFGKQGQVAEESIYRDLPRGGAQEFALAQNRLDRSSRVGELLSGAPMEGAQGLQGLAALLLGEQAGSSQQAGGLYAGLLSNETERRATNMANMTSLGTALGKLLWTELFKTSGSKTSTPGSSSTEPKGGGWTRPGG